MLQLKSNPQMACATILVLLTACGSSSTSPVAANGGDGGPSAGNLDAGPTPRSLDAGGPPPGRPTATACSSSPNVTLESRPDGGAGCAVDSDCDVTSISTLQGKCVANPDGGPSGCNYDQCLADSDCTGSDGVCECQAAIRGTPTNICLQGNCRIDSDCGTHGPCTPSVGAGCGRNEGYVGYYCHTASDQCATDADCGNTDGGYAPYCAYDTTVGHWTCGTGVCAG